ncbi:hypothetical protein BRC84_03990 [Halobacteriales archaeon QS_1_68_44]|nr:MAG: hypothetical protein BRC84_03990 [Halobacteriales archaeon QS_1_68_44]
MRPERVGAVVNPHAGGENPAALYATLADCFPGADVDARITTGPDDVPVAAREQAASADLLAVIGGDGTLREVAAALVESEHETPLFVVPAGRGNSSYRHLYGSADWRNVARRLADGLETRPLELGRIESTPTVDPTYFLLGFTAGLFRSALNNAERLRVLPGPLAYLVATGQAAFLDEPVEASVAVDDDPLFDGTVIEPAGLGGAVSLVRLARRGRLLEHPAVTYGAGESVRVESGAGLPVEVDGTPIEIALETALLSVVPEAISVAHPDRSG